MNQIADPPQLPIVAVFDFDNTLTRRDSLLPFLQIAVGKWQFWWGIFVMIPVLARYALKLIPNWRAKEALLTYFLSGRPEKRLCQVAQNFAVKEIPKLLRPEAVQRLHWHQEQGHKTVLVSASLEAYLLPWAEAMGFDLATGTQLEVQNERLTGRILGKNCYGREKVERLRGMLGNLNQYCIYAYGDSRGDKELLATATFPYYRTFQDAPEVESKRTIPHWERGLILSVVAAAALYLGMVLWSGAEQFGAALNLVPLWLIPAGLALVFFGHCLRFVRWQWYLQQMGYQVPLRSSFQLFLASLALTASPGKAGEAIRSLLLKRRHQIPISPTLAGLFCEHFTDALSVVLLICLSLFSLYESRWAIITIGLVQLAIILAMQQPVLIKQRVLKPLARWSKLRKLVQKIEVLIDNASTLLKPKILVGATLLALVSWGLEGIVLYSLFQFLGVDSITPYQAIVIHLASGIVGVLSLLPGGIGSNEALTIGLSMLYGASQTAAVTATFLIRLLTLWFAIGIGMLVMLSVHNRLSV